MEISLRSVIIAAVLGCLLTFIATYAGLSFYYQNELNEDPSTLGGIHAACFILAPIGAVLGGVFGLLVAIVWKGIKNQTNR